MSSPANPFTALAEAGAGDDLTAEAVLDILIGPYDSDTNHPFHRMERGEITGVEWYDEVSKVLSGFDITLDASKLAGAFSSLGVHDVVIERIQSLKDDGYQTGLITNNVKEAATGWQGMVDLTMFDVVIDSCMVGMRKPNPAIYKLALDELGGVAPERAVFLDDAAGQIQQNLQAATVRLSETIAIGSMLLAPRTPMAKENLHDRVHRSWTTRHPGSRLRSDALAREVALTIWLPPSYRVLGRDLPVLYVLDAPMTFAFAAQGALITTFDEAMPEVLVVGVGEPLTSAYEWGANRARDYAPRQVPDDPDSGHAAAFFDALQQEIVPLVEGQYRTDPSDRILWGHSLGGAFAIYALLERGGLFQRVIATSPAAYEQGVQLLDPDAWPEPGASVQASLFTSIGSQDNEYRPGVDWLSDQLRARSYADLEFETVIIPDCGHIGASAFGYLSGLRSVFRGD